MPKVVMRCAGITISGHYVPPFELCSGGVVCIHVVCSDPTLHEELNRVFSGEERVPEIALSTKIMAARPAVDRRRSWWTLTRETPNDYLVKTFGLSRDTATEILRRRSLARFTDFGVLARGPRVLLAIEGAFAAAQACVFSCDGLDPENRALAYALVGQHIRHGGCALELSIPFKIGDSEIDQWECHKDAQCIEMRTALRAGARNEPQIKR